MPNLDRHTGDYEPTTVLTVPGWGGSGPAHWQTLWESSHPEYRRVTQRDWHNVNRSEWEEALERAVLAAPGRVVLVAHSLGSLTTAWWGASCGALAQRIRGALLVTPPDLASTPGCLPALASFTPAPRARLPFRSLLVASENDQYASLAAFTEMAEAWGSGLVNAGLVGHINAESDHGPWPEGERYLQELLDGAPDVIAAPKPAVPAAI